MSLNQPWCRVVGRPIWTGMWKKSHQTKIETASQTANNGSSCWDTEKNSFFTGNLSAHQELFNRRKMLGWTVHQREIAMENFCIFISKRREQQHATATILAHCAACTAENRGRTANAMPPKLPLQNMQSKQNMFQLLCSQNQRSTFRCKKDNCVAKKCSERLRML